MFAVPCDAQPERCVLQMRCHLHRIRSRNRCRPSRTLPLHGNQFPTRLFALLQVGRIQRCLQRLTNAFALSHGASSRFKHPFLSKPGPTPLWKSPPPRESESHSYRKASIGSTFIARSAGNTHAAIVTTASKAETPANVHGSDARTPK